MRKLFCILLCLTGAISLSGCDDNVLSDGNNTDYFMYHNKLDIPISFDYYDHIEDNLITKNVELGISGVFLEGANMFTSTPLDVLFHCDSVRIIFNNKKELWYFRTKEKDKTGNVFNLDNYRLTEETKYERRYEYYFTEKILELATDIQ